MADFIHYWRLPKARRVFDDAIEPIGRLEDYGFLERGDRVWVLSGTVDGVVLVLRFVVRRVRDPHAYSGGRDTDLPRAIRFTWSDLRRLRFDTHRSRPLGTPYQLLTGAFASFRLLRPESVPVLERLWRVRDRPRWDPRQLMAEAGPFQPDVTKRKAVEGGAIAAATAHFQRKGFHVRDVQRECIGYDLACSKGRTELHIEVKGSQGLCASFQFTHGELKRARIDNAFRLCTVSHALEARPTVSVVGRAALLRDFMIRPYAFIATRKR